MNFVIKIWDLDVISITDTVENGKKKMYLEMISQFGNDLIISSIGRYELFFAL